MSASYPDVLVVGGGVIGLSTALRLADDGVAVTVLDRQQVGREASWAGAGMLPPGHDTTLPSDSTPKSQERYLRCLSNSIWPELSARLLEQTGIDNGYRNCGAVEVIDSPAAFENRLMDWRAEGIRVEPLGDRSEIEKIVPGLNERFTDAVWLPDFCQARNPRHLKALRAACQLSGVEILEDIADLTLRANGAAVTASTTSRTFPAERICVTAGSWTRQVFQPLHVELPIRPIRGQIVQLSSAPLPFRCVIEQGERYLVPRPDGLILVGATQEDVGFEKQTTSQGISGLLDFAKSLVPELAEASVVCQWAGLRPGSPEGLPFLGRVDAFDNLYVGAGHFRSGLQMSPASAQLLAQTLMDCGPELIVETRTAAT
jgi:glycine oxidase